MTKPVTAVAALFALVVSLGACSGDDSSDAATIAPPASTSASPTSDPVDPTDPTQPPATDPPATVAVSTTTTSSTTTTAAPPSVEEQIAADYQLIYDGYWACLRAPLNCDTSWLVPGSGSDDAMNATMQALVDRGRYVGEEDPGYFVIESITIDPDGTTAEVVTCWRLTGVLYGPPVDDTRPVGPDNPATIANNTPGSGRQRDLLVRSPEGGWQVESSDVFDSQENVNQCAEET
jgi:hypothetical protein